MLERLLEQHDAFTLVRGGVPSMKNLSPQQWLTVADLVAALHSFLDVTQEMSGAAYPTFSMVIPILHGLQHVLQTTSSGLDVLRERQVP